MNQKYIGIILLLATAYLVWREMKRGTSSVGVAVGTPTILRREPMLLTAAAGTVTPIDPKSRF